MGLIATRALESAEDACVSYSPKGIKGGAGGGKSGGSGAGSGAGKPAGAGGSQPKSLPKPLPGAAVPAPEQLPNDPYLPPVSLSKKVVPVNGTVNVGGGGAGAKTGEYPGKESSLNPLVGPGGPTKNFPNNVKGYFRDIDKYFAAGSVTNLRSQRLTFSSEPDWGIVARRTAAVMAHGGTVRLNIWTGSEAETKSVVDAFNAAGFEVKIDPYGGTKGAGVFIVGKYK